MVWAMTILSMFGVPERFGKALPDPARDAVLLELNSVNTAFPADAAARQGEYEAVYRKMFETPKRCGEPSQNKNALFRAYDAEPGLVAEYDAAVADPGASDGVEADKAAAQALAVSGTPTIYFDGKLLEAQTLDGFRPPVEAKGP